MVTMVIVEDERFEREALKNCIDWELIGVEIVGEAADGASGLSMVIEKKPDIVLTDVCMPVMDAIEMSKNIRSIVPETKIIFISSYDDFEYVRQGISLSICAYVTKPVKEEELLRVVKKAADDIIEQKMEAKIYSKIKNNYNISLWLARQAAVCQLMTRVPVTREHLDYLGLGWLEWDQGYKGVFLWVPENPKECSEGVRLLENKEFPGCVKAVTTRIGDGRGATITLWEAVPDDGMAKAAETVILELLKEGGIRVKRLESAWAGCAGQGIDELYESILRKGISFKGGIAGEMMDKKRSRSEIVEAVEQIIKENYDKSLSIESIAKSLHFTPNYIGTVFKREKKEGINRYLLNVRMEHACKKLEYTDKAINEIALECGYENVTYFHTIFKKEVGMTPSEFRQRKKL